MINKVREARKMVNSIIFANVVGMELDGLDLRETLESQVEVFKELDDVLVELERSMVEVAVND